MPLASSKDADEDADSDNDRDEDDEDDEDDKDNGDPSAGRHVGHVTSASHSAWGIR
jgi:hypothetical protein